MANTRNYRSDRINHLRQSGIRAVTQHCNRVNGINLGQGICPLASPAEILESTATAILDDKSIYSRFDGVDELRQAIAKKALEYNNIPADPEKGVVVTVGSAGAFVCTLQALFNQGDEIITFEPFYGYHINSIRVSGCVPRIAPLKLPDWSFTRETLDAALSPRTKAILVCNPSNPCGKVFTESELQIIADFCQQNDLLAITDEIYEYILSDNRKHISLASVPGMYERTVTISGFSKTFAITGWRLGYAVAPEHLSHPIGLVNDLFYICAPTPLQYGLAQGMAKLPNDYYENLSIKYQEKRDYFCEVLNDVGLTPHVPHGAYYVLTDVSSLGLQDDHHAMIHLLETGGVASVPGSSFFQSPVGKQLVRFCYAHEWDVLKEAAHRLKTRL